MRRKNRKWAAMAVGLYLLVMWSAYRWSIGQRPTDGNILDHIQNEEMRKFKERRALAAEEEAKAQPHLAEARLNAAGPAFVAARYDRNHIVFVVATNTESRFSASPLMRSGGKPTRISAPANPAAPLAGLQELWEPDSQTLHFFPAIVQKTQPGEQWILSLSATTTIPVAIERTVIAPAGCSLGMGFLASIPPDQQHAFAPVTIISWFVTPRLRPLIRPSLPTSANCRIGKLRRRLPTRSNSNSTSACSRKSPTSTPACWPTPTVPAPRPQNYPSATPARA